jgi:hypothetical protein
MAIASMPRLCVSSFRALPALVLLAAACSSPASPGDPGTDDEEVDAAAPVTADAGPKPRPETDAPVKKPEDAAAPVVTPDADQPAPADAGPVLPADSGVVPDPGGEGRITDGLTQLLVSSGVGMGYYHACHLLASMDIKCYGDPLTHPRLRPPAGVKSKQIACAHDGCCVLQPPEAGARLRCWSDKAPFFPPAEISKSVDPLQIGIGYNHDCVLNTDHTVKCWGQAATKFTPPAGLMAKSIAVAAFFNCAVTMDDSVVCWGLNPPMPPEGLKAKLVAATFHGTSKLEMANGAGETRHACAIKLDDTVTCWGDNVGGNTEVPADLGPVKDLAVATFNSCALKLDGTPVCWGTKLYDPSAARVHPMPKDLKLKAIKSKMASYCGLQLDDTLVCWGDSKTGHVSIPAGTKIYVP